MPLRLIIILTIFAFFFTFFVCHYIIKRKLMIRYALLWLIFCIAMTIAVISCDLLRIICNHMDIKTVSNFIFFIVFCLLLIITFLLTVVISKQRSRITVLVQEMAILKHKIEKR